MCTTYDDNVITPNHENILGSWQGFFHIFNKRYDTPLHISYRP